ncbi:ADP-ribose diphosphatase [Alteromonas oceanisediminis]|uniref:ADP-ribose diphosphatase n=1 Tax=Alteromonas oceanisediminis TaxID=2836180 RepID=UPI0028F418D3|nr:ADP-ribose diphosphatase [Alteromonas oceanisediminis]
MKRQIQRFSRQDIRQLEKSPLYDGYFKMVKYQFEHRLYGGGWSEPVAREIFERGHAVGVLPYDPIRAEFILIEQVRIGALATSDRPWLIEIIAGIIDPGEEERAVCVRESQEEAGIEITQLTKACTYLASPGGTTERMHIYMACVDAATAKGVHGLDNEAEDILVHRVKESEARQWLDDGIIDNAAAMVALQWFFLNKSRLMRQWQNSDAE